MNKEMKDKSGSSKGARWSRADNWDILKTKQLIGFFTTEHDNCPSKNGNFGPDTWSRVVREFRKTGDMDITDAKVKNKWKALKQQYREYLMLVNKSGWGWDPVLKVPVPESNEMWDEILQVYPKFEAYKKKAWPFYEDIDRICGGSTATGAHAYTSGQSQNVGDSQIGAMTIGLDESEASSEEMENLNAKNKEAIEDTSIHVINLGEDPMVGKFQKKASKSKISATLSGKKSGATPSTTGSRSKRKVNNEDAWSTLADVCYRRAELAKKKLQREEQEMPILYSMNEAIDKLYALSGITPEQKYACAMELEKKEQRVIFMKMTDMMDINFWIQMKVEDFRAKKKAQGTYPYVQTCFSAATTTTTTTTSTVAPTMAKDVSDEAFFQNLLNREKSSEGDDWLCGRSTHFDLNLD